MSQEYKSTLGLLSVIGIFVAIGYYIYTDHIYKMENILVQQNEQKLREYSLVTERKFEENRHLELKVMLIKETSMFSDREGIVYSRSE
jgi:hypothetical protein